jgi:cytochrome c peroxidase
MSCHSQIAVDRASLAPIRDSFETGQPVNWNRVNQLPDHVFFDHEIHVNKGVGCETCHGRVDQMSTAVKANTFYMSWCLECHRQPEKYLRPVDEVTSMGYQPAEDQIALGTRLLEEHSILSSQQLTNCSICHR